jgi:hypothetical protein
MMLCEAVWLMYALGIGIFLIVGLMGLFFSCSSSVSGGISKGTALLLSILIIVTGIYFFYQWNAKKAEFRQVGRQVEWALQQYLSPQQKGKLSPQMASDAGRRYKAPVAGSPSKGE